MSGLLGVEPVEQPGLHHVAFTFGSMGFLAWGTTSFALVGQVEATLGG